MKISYFIVTTTLTLMNYGSDNARYDPKLDIEEPYRNLTNYREVKGRISSINQKEQTFNIGSDFFIYYGSAIETPINGPLLGQWVEVKGEVRGGTFYAVQVETLDLGSELGNQQQYKGFECEGIASNYDDINHTFTVTSCKNGLSLIINNSVYIDEKTHFEDLTPWQINGLNVSVKGAIIDKKNIAKDVKKNIIRIFPSPK